VTPLLAGDYLLSAVAQNELGQTGPLDECANPRVYFELILPVIAITDAPETSSGSPVPPSWSAGPPTTYWFGSRRVQVVSGTIAPKHRRLHE